MKSAYPSPFTSRMVPLLVSTGVLALDRPTQNCQVALVVVWAPTPARTRQNTHPGGSAPVGTALVLLFATAAVIASGCVHARSLQRPTTGVPPPELNTQRRV